MAKNQKGFTLIEVLIVVAILAVIALIGMGSYLNSGKSLSFAKSVEQVQNEILNTRTIAKSGKNYYQNGEEMEHYVVEIKATEMNVYSESTAEANILLDDPANPEIHGDYLVKQFNSTNLSNTTLRATDSLGNFLKYPVWLIFDYQTGEFQSYFNFNSNPTLIPEADHDFIILEVIDNDSGNKQRLIFFQHSGQISKLKQEDYQTLIAGQE